MLLLLLLPLSLLLLLLFSLLSRFLLFLPPRFLDLFFFFPRLKDFFKLTRGSKGVFFFICPLSFGLSGYRRWRVMGLLSLLGGLRLSPLPVARGPRATPLYWGRNS